MKIRSVDDSKVAKIKLFSIDKYARCAEMTGVEARIFMLINFLYKRRGVNPSEPDVYFDIESRLHTLNNQENRVAMENELQSKVLKYQLADSVSIAFENTLQGTATFKFMLEEDTEVSLEISKASGKLLQATMKDFSR